MVDVLIIGGGVVGCFIAKELAKYQAKVLLLEKNNDICSETTMANSAIVHSGYDPLPNTVKAIANIKGNPMFDELCQELDVEFIRNGSLTVALSEEEVETLRHLQERAKENGVLTKILNAKQVHELEPNLTGEIHGALSAPACGIVNPFELTVALMENAMENGVQLELNAKVIGIKKTDQGYIVQTKDHEYHTKIIVNAAGVYADEVGRLLEEPTFSIQARKGEYMVLDHFDQTFVNHTIFMVPTNKGKGVVITPTTHSNYLIGPSSDFVENKEDTSTKKETLDQIKEIAKKLIDPIPYQHLIRTFSGLRAVSSNNDFIIEESRQNKGFIYVAGIQSPGLASSPYIAKMVEEIILRIESFPLKNDYHKGRRPMIKLRRLSKLEKDALIEQDARYGHIVCRCEQVSEGEIVDVIHRLAGGRTVKGVKKRIRPGFGKCQGSFCEAKVIEILARELKVKKKEIPYDSPRSRILKYETKK